MTSELISHREAGRWPVRAVVRAGIVALVVALLPARAVAQEVGSVAVIAGVSQYDLSGTGTTAVISFRGSSSLDRTLLAEVALAYLPYTSQGQDQVHHLFPEIQAQAQWTGASVRPYLGVGAGASFAWADEREGSDTELTLSAAGGVRWPVREGWAVQAELRIRSIDPWAGTTADWGLGVAGRF